MPRPKQWRTNPTYPHRHTASPCSTHRPHTTAATRRRASTAARISKATTSRIRTWATTSKDLLKAHILAVPIRRKEHTTRNKAGRRKATTSSTRTKVARPMGASVRSWVCWRAAAAWTLYFKGTGRERCVLCWIFREKCDCAFAGIRRIWEGSSLPRIAIKNKQGLIR